MWSDLQQSTSSISRPPATLILLPHMLACSAFITVAGPNLLSFNRIASLQRHPCTGTEHLDHFATEECFDTTPSMLPLAVQSFHPSVLDGSHVQGTPSAAAGLIQAPLPVQMYGMDWPEVQ